MLNYIAQKFFYSMIFFFFATFVHSKHIDIPGRTRNDIIERHHNFIYHLSELVSDK